MNKICLFWILLTIVSCSNDKKQIDSINSHVVMNENSTTYLSLNTDTIAGFFNDDNLEDFILTTVNSASDSKKCKIFIGENNTHRKVKELHIGLKFSDLLNDDINNLRVYYTGNVGQFGIFASCCAGTKEYYTEIYGYNDSDWQLKCSYSHAFVYEPYFHLEYADSTIQKQTIEELYQEVYDMYTKNILEDSDYDIISIGKSLDLSGLGKNNLVKMNDIAYYFEQSGMYAEAIYLLKVITKDFPDRTAAHLNLADAYWGLGSHEGAIKAYKTYSEQMSDKGKQTKVPKRVYQRMKQ